MGEGRLRRLGRLCRGTRLTGPGSSPARPTESLATPTSLPPSTKPLGSPGWHAPPSRTWNALLYSRARPSSSSPAGPLGGVLGFAQPDGLPAEGTPQVHISQMSTLPAVLGHWPSLLDVVYLQQRGGGGGVCRDAVPWLRPPPCVPTTTAGSGAGLTRGWTTQTSCCQSWRAG